MSTRDTIVDESWVAVAYGALDVTDSARFAAGTELIVVPTKPGEPLLLLDAGARLWRKLLSGPVPESELSADERTIVHEMAEIGLASTDPSHPARVYGVTKPWLSSPMHELVYALVASVARDGGVPLVVIKGPALHRQGLREREHSGDVDVWVEPSRVHALADMLLAWGWTEVPDVWGHTEINHSVSLESRTGWACEIDVHRRMPGVGLADPNAFAIVLRQSEDVVFAGVECRVPVREMHAVLYALHELRPRIDRRHAHAPVAAASRVLAAGGEGVLDATVMLAAARPLNAALELAFPAAKLDLSAAAHPRDWYWRAQPNKIRGYALAMVHGAHWTQWPAVAVRLIWPPSDVVRASERSVQTRPERMLEARCRRMWRALRDLRLRKEPE